MEPLEDSCGTQTFLGSEQRQKQGWVIGQNQHPADTDFPGEPQGGKTSPVSAMTWVPCRADVGIQEGSCLTLLSSWRKGVPWP